MNQVVIPVYMRPYLRILHAKSPIGEIPTGWDCYAIIQPQSYEYYSGLVANPHALLENLLNYPPDKIKSTSYALRKLLEKGSGWQLAVFSKSTRNTAEQWLGTQGYHRVTTKMGQGLVQQRVLYKVYSPYLKVTRYVSGVVNATNEELIKEATLSLLRWVNSGARGSFAIRHAMRSAVKSTYNETGSIFEPDSTVTATTYFTNEPVNNFRTVVAKANMDAIIKFVNSNTGTQLVAAIE